ncbi:MAG: hypothetical protein ACOH5I_15085 [Oligoflexus sp.]
MESTPISDPNEQGRREMLKQPVFEQILAVLGKNLDLIMEITAALFLRYFQYEDRTIFPISSTPSKDWQNKILINGSDLKD